MLVFHHIPKTAGSTFNHAISEANPDTSVIVGAGGISSLKASRLERCRFLGGHVTFDEFSSLPAAQGCVHVSLLRDPIARIVSFFEMVYRDDQVFREEICYADKWDQGFRVFYERFILDSGLRNLQCSYFSYNGKFYDAVKAIMANFQIVGTVDRFDAFSNRVLFFFDGLSLVRPDSFPAKNKSTAGEDYRSLIPKELLERVASDNHEDCMLWDWINTRHDGLFVSNTLR